MTQAAAALIAELEAEGRAAWRAEDSAREKLAQEIARLERRRQFAYRRMNLVRALVSAAAGAPSADAAAPLQRRAVIQELAVEHESDFHRELLDRLRPVGDVVWQCACGEDDAAAKPRVIAELETFERWFEGAHGKSFYALFDQEPIEIPLVEA